MTSICVSPAPSSQRWRPHPHQRNRGRPASSFASLHDLRLHVSTSLRPATPLHFALSIHSPSAGLCPPSPSRRHMGRLRGHGQSRALLFHSQGEIKKTEAGPHCGSPHCDASSPPLLIHSPSAGLCPPSPSRRHMGHLRGHGHSRALLFHTLFIATTL